MPARATKRARLNEPSLEDLRGFGAYERRPADDRLVWSPGLLRTYGLTEAPADEGGFTNLVHPADRVRVEAETVGFPGSDAGTCRHVFRIVQPDGAIRTVLDRARSSAMHNVGFRPSRG